MDKYLEVSLAGWRGIRLETDELTMESIERLISEQLPSPRGDQSQLHRPKYFLAGTATRDHRCGMPDALRAIRHDRRLIS